MAEDGCSFSCSHLSSLEPSFVFESHPLFFLLTLRSIALKPSHHSPISSLRLLCHLLPPPLPSPPPTNLGLNPNPRIFLSNAALSTSSTVEHFVLFKLSSSTNPSKVDTILLSLHALFLTVVSQLFAGPFLCLRSTAASELVFTDFLHSRYESKVKLLEYTNDPAHVNFINYFFFICIKRGRQVSFNLYVVP